eukprot:5546136-Amphidinium_carterae.2
MDTRSGRICPRSLCHSHVTLLLAVLVFSAIPDECARSQNAKPSLTITGVSHAHVWKFTSLRQPCHALASYVFTEVSKG